MLEHSLQGKVEEQTPDRLSGGHSEFECRQLVIRSEEKYRNGGWLSGEANLPRSHWGDVGTP